MKLFFRMGKWVFRRGFIPGPGCADECCGPDDGGGGPGDCPVIEGVPCPGQGDGPFPRVFHRIDPTFTYPCRCGVWTGPGNNPSDNICYEFSLDGPCVSNPPTGAQVIIDATLIRWCFLCCDCLEGCGHVEGDVPDCGTPGLTHHKRCCCTRAGRWEASYAYRWQSINSNNPYPDIHVWQASGSTTYDENEQIVENTGSGFWTHDTFANGPNGPYPVRYQGDLTWNSAPNTCLDPLATVLAIADDREHPATFSLGSPVFVFRWANPNDPNDTRDANYKCPSEVFGLRHQYTVQGTTSEDASMGSITDVQCGSVRRQWTGQATYIQAGYVQIETSASFTYSNRRTTQGRCANTLNCSGGSTPVVPLDRREWNIAVKLVSLLRTDADKGVGDTAARVLGAVGGKAYESWFKRVAKRGCGCSDRAAYLNARFPYPE